MLLSIAIGGLLYLPRTAIGAGVLLVCIPVMFPLRAQMLLKASLTVSVTDESGSVVPRATVTIVNEAQQIKVTKDTDENGRAALSVDPGSYLLSVNVPGFRKWHQQIGIEKADSRRIEVRLKVGGCPPGPCLTVYNVYNANELMPTSPPMDSVWVEEQ